MGSFGREIRIGSRVSLEPSFHPLELLGAKWWDNLVLAVVNHAVKRTSVVSLIKDGLQRQRNIRIAGHKWNGNSRQPLFKLDRIDQEILGVVETMDANVIVEPTGFLDSQLPG